MAAKSGFHASPEMFPPSELLAFATLAEADRVYLQHVGPDMRRLIAAFGRFVLPAFPQAEVGVPNTEREAAT